MKWFRLWTDILDDVKMFQLSDYEFRMWIFLLSYCSEVNAESGQCQTKVNSMSIRFRTQVNHLSRAFETFQRIGLIKISEDGYIIITNWNKRQFKSDNAYDRVKKYRQSQPDMKRFKGVTRNVSETAPDTDTDTDTDNTPYNPPKGNILFMKFWECYPRKIGKSAALKAWNKSDGKRPPINVVLAAVEKQKTCDQWCKDNGQYIPHPATWINQGRWDDEVNTQETELDRWERERTERDVR